jgi:hypothetical protein
MYDAVRVDLRRGNHAGCCHFLREGMECTQYRSVSTAMRKVNEGGVMSVCHERECRQVFNTIPELLHTCCCSTPVSSKLEAAC